MTDNRSGEQGRRESEPLPAVFRIGDIITVRHAPAERRLVSQGDVEGVGMVDAFRLFDGDTRTSVLPGSVRISDITAVVGHMDAETAINMMISSTVGENGGPALEASLRSIMNERLQRERGEHDG